MSPVLSAKPSQGETEVASRFVQADGFIAAFCEPYPLLGCAAGRSLRSTHGRHYEFGTGSNAGWPAARDRFQPGTEANAFRAVHVVVSEDRRFPSTKKNGKPSAPESER